MSFYRFCAGLGPRNQGDALYIDGAIAAERSWWGGDGEVLARQFRQRLAQCRDVTVYINSPGGDVFAAAEIYSALRAHPHPVTVKVMGIAASAASVIAMAGDTVLMSPVSYLMIHDPWTIAVGNALEMEKTADVLRTIGEGIVSAYTDKTGKSAEEIKALLAAETYMSAKEAISLGFADGLWRFEDKPADTAQVNGKGLLQAHLFGPAAVMAMLAEAPPDKPDGAQTSPKPLDEGFFDAPGAHTHPLHTHTWHQHANTLGRHTHLGEAAGQGLAAGIAAGADAGALPEHAAELARQLAQKAQEQKKRADIARRAAVIAGVYDTDPHNTITV